MYRLPWRWRLLVGRTSTSSSSCMSCCWYPRYGRYSMLGLEHPKLPRPLFGGRWQWTFLVAFLWWQSLCRTSWFNVFHSWSFLSQILVVGCLLSVGEQAHRRHQNGMGADPRTGFQVPPCGEDNLFFNSTLAVACPGSCLNETYCVSQVRDILRESTYASGTCFVKVPLLRVGGRGTCPCCALVL